MGGSSKTQKKNEGETSTAQSAPPVMFLPWLGASYDPGQQPVAPEPAEPAKPNRYAGILSQRDSNAFPRRNAGVTFGGSFNGQEPIYAHTLGLNGNRGIIGYRNEKTKTQQDAGNNQTVPFNAEGYDAGPMQALLAQQLQQGFGGDPANYQSQFNALYRPMQVTPGSGILDDKKKGDVDRFAFGHDGRIKRIGSDGKVKPFLAW